MTSIEAALAYHEATKHHPHRYARSPGYLDWANQPEPFRTYQGAVRHALPLVLAKPTIAYDDLYRSWAIATQPITLETIGLLFESSLAVSAWKQYGENRWALRCNPSSGNLHPTEGYLICNTLTGLADRPAVYHYAPLAHALEQRAAFSTETWRTLTADFPGDVCFIGLTSIHWREAWKYGERAYRYCQHDVGHAVAALRYAAALIGRRLVWLHGLNDAHLARLLGVVRDDGVHPREREAPDLLLALLPATGTAPSTLPAASIDAIAAASWKGMPNQLSANHVTWSRIDDAHAACEKQGAARFTDLPIAASVEVEPAATASAYGIIQQRRSAVSFDGRTGVSLAWFYRMLARTLPDSCAAPWDALPDVPRIDLLLFVHRVEGIAPGLYCLVRSDTRSNSLRAAMNNSFAWEKPVQCPKRLPLFLLKQFNCEDLAVQASCDQDIAGDSAFSLGMLAEFEETIRAHDAWYYRRLFWETGMIGQTLYLEAEAAGLRGTGIGCFYDDAVHTILGLTDKRFQSLYHFTVGGPVEDTRLMTLPPYPDARRSKLPSQ